MEEKLFLRFLDCKGCIWQATKNQNAWKKKSIIWTLVYTDMFQETCLWGSLWWPIFYPG